MNTTPSAHETIHEVIVIGSGPAGYTAALYAARAQLTPLVFEGTSFGGALMTTTEVENYPGFRNGITGPELMDDMREQALRFGAELRTEDVESVSLRGPIKSVVTAEGQTYQARAVILAMGTSVRYLQIPGEQELLGRGVSACATCDGSFFRGQDIAVIGGGDSAMEEALFLTRFARSVTLVHRRDEFRASKIMLGRARNNDKIKFITNHTVVAVNGYTTVTGLRLRNTTTGEETTLVVTGVFVAIGHEPRSSLVSDVVDIDPDGYVLVKGRTTSTSMDGVFAAGDLVDRTYRQAITAAGSGCAAAIDAERWLAEHAGSKANETIEETGDVDSTDTTDWSTAMTDAKNAGVTIEVTDASFFADVLSSNKPVLVDFWATWCGPCKMVAPVLEEIASEQRNQLTVAKLDVDTNPEMAREFQVVSIPTMILFQGGQPVKRIVGAKGKAALLRDLSDVVPNLN